MIIVDNHVCPVIADTKLQKSYISPDPLLMIEQRRKFPVNNGIIFSEVDIVTPGQKLLAQKLTFEINAGQSMLVTGMLLCLSS
jgi:ABC-type uncharacterized transport system fused permease/ATPase subunit